MGYVYLSIAIVAEVIATSTLQASNGFSRLWPSLVTVLGYALAFYCLSLTLRRRRSAEKRRRQHRKRRRDECSKR